MTPTRFLHADEAHQRFDPELVARLARGLDETDAHGDAIVATCAAQPGGNGMRMIDAWLDGTAPLPPQLASLLEPLAEVPDWVDFDRLERASIAYWRAGFWTGLTLNCASLAAGYRSGAGVKPLTFTGRLVRMAYRRQQETGRWLIAATSPGGLRRDAPGFRETIRVRIIHASVRRRILASETWQADAWGAPINLTDTAYGITGEFSTVPIAALRDAGLHYSSSEREDIQHLWRYVGHLLGLPDDLLAADEARALEMVAIKDFTDTPADEDSRALVRALIEQGTPPELLVPGPLAGIAGRMIPPTLYGMTRRWAGDDIADELGIPDTPLKHLVPVLRPAVRAIELLRRAGLRDPEKMAANAIARVQAVLDAGHAPAGTMPAHEAGQAIAITQ
jgi:ER-bound oxygenase mpaB/B'/Rubber oxygenase, catalytic domain